MKKTTYPLTSGGKKEFQLKKNNWSYPVKGSSVAQRRRAVSLFPSLKWDDALIIVCYPDIPVQYYPCSRVENMENKYSQKNSRYYSSQEYFNQF